ncbi:MAG: hypothetical protein AB1899_06100 [Pseudomonadota bacterium]
MTLSLYSTYRAWRHVVQAEKVAPAHAGRPFSAPVREAIACLGVGLAGIACGGDVAVQARR